MVSDILNVQNKPFGGKLQTSTITDWEELWDNSIRTIQVFPANLEPFQHFAAKVK